MKVQNINLSEINKQISNLSLNAEDIKLNNNNLDNIESNQVAIITQSINNLNLNKGIDYYKLENNYQNEFFIFNKGGENEKIKFIINQFLQNNENENNIMSNSISHSPETRIKRKEGTDILRTKIKYRFFRNLIKVINQKLKLVNSKKYFAPLPQNFIRNVKKDLNRVMFNKTFKELFSINFEKSQNKDVILSHKNKNNLAVLEYLENEKDISEKINYNCFKNLKMYQIFDEYLKSKEFENEILNFELKGEEESYIYKYIKLAINLNIFLAK